MNTFQRLVLNVGSALAISITVQVAQAAPDSSTQKLDVACPITSAMQSALSQATSQHSKLPISNILNTVPETQRATLALSLFLQVENDAEARSYLADQLFASGGINREHILLLTQAYLRTVQHPLKELPLARGIDPSPFWNELALQTRIGLLLATHLGVQHQYIYDATPGKNPLERLARIFDLAQQAHPDATLSAQIQVCQQLLSP